MLCGKIVAALESMWSWKFLPSRPERFHGNPPSRGCRKNRELSIVPMQKTYSSAAKIASSPVSVRQRTPMARSPSSTISTALLCSHNATLSPSSTARCSSAKFGSGVQREK